MPDLPFVALNVRLHECRLALLPPFRWNRQFSVDKPRDNMELCLGDPNKKRYIVKIRTCLVLVCVNFLFRFMCLFP